jgi:peroxiredoxin
MLILLIGVPGATAQEDIGFESTEVYDTKGQPFDDLTIMRLIETLDELLVRPEVIEDFGTGSRIHFWRFHNRLAMGVLTESQVAKIGSYLKSLAERHPDHVEYVQKQMWTVENLMIGREAPEIVGRDMDGVEFSLSDYRGNVVVLVFTGHWCGPCRSEYPYQRLLLEVMADDPVVILGVNSDDDREFAKAAKKEERLDYQMWWAGWDAEGEDPRRSRIPAEWNVVGWPTIYILDDKGVIRYKDARHEKTITAVKELLSEIRRRGSG